MIGISVSPLRPKKFGISYDADAAAFFTAAGITSTTQKSAVNTLVKGLKSNSLWTKFYALYPMVGGSATSHKFNLKNPADTDAAFRLSFSGGWTHSSTGALPNGTNTFADTFFNISTSGLQDSLAYHYYSRTNSVGAYSEMGVFISPNLSQLSISFSGTMFPLVNQSIVAPSVAVADSSGLFVSNRRASNVVNGFRNGVKLVEDVTASTTPINNTVYLGARRLASGATYSNRECAFGAISTGITDAEAATLYTLVQAFQTSLSRQI